MTDRYVPVPPLVIWRAVGGDYSVLIDARGVPVASGSRAMCERVAAGQPLFSRQAQLWEEGNGTVA